MQEPLIVIFGGAGYIGSVLTRRLLQHKFRVRVVDNFLFGKLGAQNFDTNRLEVINANLCDTCAVSSATKGAYAVILLAAIVGRRVEDIRRANMRDINLLASSVILDAAAEHGASRFIFASTDSVYGLQSGVMYETGTPEPVSLFSRLKLRMEERVINARGREFHPTALRIGTCHGSSPRMRFDLAANAFVRDAIYKKEITVRGGDQWRSLVHVDDVATAFVSCIKAHVNLTSGEVFNVGSNDQNIQIKKLATSVKDLIPETKITFLDAGADLVDYHLSCSKIHKILDFSPKWSIEMSLEQMRAAIEQGDFPDPYGLRYHNT